MQNCGRPKRLWHMMCNRSLSSPDVLRMQIAGRELFSSALGWTVMSDLISGINPGEITTVSGQYQEVGPQGRKGRVVTVAKDEALPPTTVPGSTYTLIDRTKDKSCPE